MSQASVVIGDEPLNGAVQTVKASPPVQVTSETLPGTLVVPEVEVGVDEGRGVHRDTDVLSWSGTGPTRPSVTGAERGSRGSTEACPGPKGGSLDEFRVCGGLMDCGKEGTTEPFWSPT